ncbi:MAG: transcriptional regulator, partial [Chloroflexi bacterium]|nr:transcriptional regulator [Chloroflexota bacterium]MBU1661306.1 transcriptional regulator [Chloroflexota bacterium]
QSADFLFLQRETELTKGNLSAHLSMLEEAGNVAITVVTYFAKIGQAKGASQLSYS